MEHFDVAPGLLEVIYPPLDENLSIDRPIHPEMDRMVEGDYLLFVGSRNVHKNLKCLIDAFAELLPEFPGMKLVIAGARMRRRDEVDEAMETGRFHDGVVIQYVAATDREIGNLYAHARALVFPSLIEGFGIPPLEAVARGVPAVCSDIPVIREVCGDAVKYADPDDPSAFTAAVRETLMSPPDSGNTLAGRDRIRRYSKGKIAGQFIRLFKECAGK
jgi:glycosyltransferase involved in cell wall biosynthesis